MRTVSVGTHPRLLAFDGSHIWVTVSGEDKVVKILAATGAVVGTYAVPGYPYAIAYDGSAIWVTTGLDNSVTKMTASTGSVVGSYPAGNGPNGIAFDGASIWISNQVCSCVVGMTPGCTSCPPGTVTKIRASDGAAMGTYFVGTRPQWVAFDGRRGPRATGEPARPGRSCGRDRQTRAAFARHVFMPEAFPEEPGWATGTGTAR